jgi:predicted MPP superfamily phosphohydrolase
MEGYARGLYQTPAGPLYVNPGLGTFHLPIRFGCRPEITMLDL